MMKKLTTPRNAILIGGLIALLLAVAFSWRTDNRLHVYVLNIDGHPSLLQTPGGKQILIGGSNSPSSLLSRVGQLLPFWDRDIDLMVVPQASNDQLNGLSAVLDRYDVKQIMSVEAPVENQAGRDWQALLMQKGKQPIELQSAGLEDGTALSFDGNVPLIEVNGQRVAFGPSEQAQINIIDGQIDRLPQQPQMIFTWTPIVSDTRVIDLTERGTLDLALGADGVSIGEVR